MWWCACLAVAPPNLHDIRCTPGACVSSLTGKSKGTPRFMATIMQLAAYRGQSSQPLTCPCIQVSKEQLRKLLVHSIPAAATPEQLQQVFQGAGHPYSNMEGKVADRKLHVLFEHPGAADAAFTALPGQRETDSMGRATKVVSVLQCTIDVTSCINVKLVVHVDQPCRCICTS